MHMKEILYIKKINNTGGPKFYLQDVHHKTVKWLYPNLS